MMNENDSEIIEDETVMNENDIEIIEDETVWEGHFRVKRLRLRHRLFAGGWSQPLQREIFTRGDAVAALLFDPHLEKLVMIQQFRVGAMGPGHNPWLTELVAGLKDKPGESEPDVIIREAREETGVEILDLIPIQEYWVSPGGFTERVFLYCAKVDASGADGIHGNPHEGEDIKVLVWDVQHAFDVLQKGEIDNSMTIIALQWLRLNYEDVIAKWA